MAWQDTADPDYPTPILDAHADELHAWLARNPGWHTLSEILAESDIPAGTARKIMFWPQKYPQFERSAERDGRGRKNYYGHPTKVYRYRLTELPVHHRSKNPPPYQNPAALAILQLPKQKYGANV